MASQLAKLKALRAPEKKEVQTYLANTTFNAQTPTTLVALINSVGEGSDATQRIGRKITHNYIEVKLIINSYVTGPYDAGFWSIVLDRQPTGSLPAFTDIYDTTTASNVPGLACRNTLVNPDRFKVLATEDYVVSTLNSGQGATGPYYCSRFIDLRKLKGTDALCTWGSSSGGIANVTHGAIYIMFASTLAQAATPNTVYYLTKYRFTDV